VFRAWGDAVQVWREDRQVGNVYRFLVVGENGQWTASAEKHRLIPEFDGGECEFRFAPAQEEGGDKLEGLHGTGRFSSTYLADGSVHRQPVAIEGESLWWTTAQRNESS
jgi:hypothetical protein